MNKITGGVTAAKGFFAASAEAEIKYKNRKDMALVYSQKPCVVAGTFTSNVVKAAPVLWDMDIVKNSPYAQAVIVNSGIANAGTGAEGMRLCEVTAKAAEKYLGIPKEAVLVSSTGVIGMQLPEDKLIRGVELLSKAKEDTILAGSEAAKAIMTTDTRPKEFAATIEINGKTVTLGGMSKGSGMIHPNMCTMLSYVTTDALIGKELLSSIVKEVVSDTFNMISVDGDTSTNDTFMVLANGMAENEMIQPGTPEAEEFKAALYYITESLAKLMAEDGEGASHLFECIVEGADTKEHAKILARSVISSSLSKAAVFGKDANWGRFLCALGYAGVSFDPENMDLFFEAGEEKLLVYTNGMGTDYSEEKAAELMGEPRFTVRADMKMGDKSATAWGCDLTYEYVKINADYRS